MVTTHFTREIGAGRIDDHERYRLESSTDPECVAAYHFAGNTACIRGYERRLPAPMFG